MKFKDFMNETPADGMNMDSSKSALLFSKNIINDILNIPEKNKKLKPLFGQFQYYIYEDLFIVQRNNDLILFIKYQTINDYMYILNVENTSMEKELSFKVYSAILHHKIFRRIYTGDALSTRNIKVHAKYLLSSNFNLYISDGNTEEKVDSIEEFTNIMKKSSYKSQFFLEDSMIITTVSKMYSMYNINESDRYNIMTEFLEFYINKPKHNDWRKDDI